MDKLSDNYYLRQRFFKREQVPTQSQMKKIMSPVLANVYFKSMNSKLKVLAGLEPPMKGGGKDWFVPPEDLLQSRAVLKPVRKECLSKLGFLGIDSLSVKLLEDYHKKMEEEKNQVLYEGEINCKKSVEACCRQHWEDCCKVGTYQNTETILHAFREFSRLYSTSISKMENLLFEAAINDIRNAREETFCKMSKLYERMLKQQATMLYEKYTEMLKNEQNRLKTEFILNVERSKEAMRNKIHDVNVEKHVAIEKLRNFLECQNLACQVYVALKEREECKKEMDQSKREHGKQIKTLSELIAIKEFEIGLAIAKEQKRKEFDRIWQKKVCHVVKKFQIFVKYCLHTLPEYADFFINMEKLMMLQLNEAIENPSVDSLFEPDPPKIRTPIPRPHPFYVFCDKGYKPRLDQRLCPKHCISSASHLPVIVVNKRCIYAACDNFEVFTNKIKDFIYGRRGDDVDFDDDHSYTYDVPVKVTSSQHLLELKLESSLMQLIQKEIPNARKLPLECCVCKLPYCFCSPSEASLWHVYAGRKPKQVSKTSLLSIPSGNKIETRSQELIFEREPKWESYIDYVMPKRCRCARIAKKHLQEHIPPYIKNMSIYETTELPHYETCSLVVLKKLVKQAKGKVTPPPEPEKVESKIRDMSTQFSDQEWDDLCTRFSENELRKICKDLYDIKSAEVKKPEGTFRLVGSATSAYLDKNTSSFATGRAFSLRQLLDKKPELEEIFRKPDCD